MYMSDSNYNTKECKDTFIKSKTILGNKKVISDINSWVKNLETDNKPLFLIGSSGIGKTEIAKKVLDDNGFHIHYFNSGIMTVPISESFSISRSCYSTHLKPFTN